MTSGSAHDVAIATARQRIAYHRYAADMSRLRAIALLATALWIGVGLPMHLVLFPRIGHGPAAPVLIALALPCLFQAFVLYLLARDPLPPEKVIVPIGALNFFFTGAALAFIAARTGGITSPYHLIIVLILVTQVMALPRPWLENAIVGTVTVLICPIGVLVLSRGDEVLRAQLDDPDTLARYIGLLFVLASAVAITTWSGHVQWSARQTAFESKSIGRYKLQRRIGSGGMGEVWRAHDRAIHRDVALKILSADLHRGAAMVARFEREIEATAGLSHPNTVRVFDWGVTLDGIWYYAMELLDGVDLATLVERRGRLPAPLVARLGVQAARAIAEAHERGVVHRDLKPHNLFVVAPGGVVDHVKVLDFGVARVLAGPGDDDSSMTQTGGLVGTPGYIAPEVMAGSRATAAADVWGLAATLFHALTGTSVRDANGRAAAALHGDIPRALDGVLVRALDADPGKRPASAAELASELEATGLAATWQPGLRLDEVPPPPKDFSATSATIDARPARNALS